MMQNEISTLWFRAVTFYVFLSFLPSLAMADQRVGIFNPAASSFIIPIQKEGRREVPVIKKPWYKKWWVWAIVLGAAGAGAAAGGGEDSGASGGGGSQTGSIEVSW